MNELKYFCKENLLPRVGSKSELIARVQSNLRKRKLEIIELRVKKPKLTTVKKAKGKFGVNKFIRKIDEFLPSSSPTVQTSSIPQVKPFAQVVTPITPSIRQERTVFLKSDITRKEAASVNPPIVDQNVEAKDVTLIQVGSCLKDPLSLQTRPCESAVTKAEELLRQNRQQNTAGLFLQFGHLGSFDVKDMITFKNFCLAAKIKRELDSEKIFFDNLARTLKSA